MITWVVVVIDMVYILDLVVDLYFSSGFLIFVFYLFKVSIKTERNTLQSVILTLLCWLSILLGGFFIRCWESEEEWFWPFEPFSKLKTTSFSIFPFSVTWNLNWLRGDISSGYFASRYCTLILRDDIMWRASWILAKCGRVNFVTWEGRW